MVMIGVYDIESSNWLWLSPVLFLTGKSCVKHFCFSDAFDSKQPVAT